MIKALAFPTDPAVSLRGDFREIILRSVFTASVRSINLTDDGQEWLTDRQLDELYDELLHQPGNSLREINEATLKLLFRCRWIRMR